MMTKAYKYMAKRHWNLGIIRLFNDVLYEQALSHTPNGLRFHLIDLCIEELAKANQTADIPLTEATFLDCVEPYFALASKAVDKNVQKRVMDKVMLRFLNEYSYVSDVALKEDNEGHEEESLVFREVHVGTVAKFIFEVASESDTDERYRKALYEMHKTYVRQIRAAGRDVVLEDFDESEEGEEYYEDKESTGNDQITKSDDVEAASQESAGERVKERDEEKERSKKKKTKKKKDKMSKKKEHLDIDGRTAVESSTTTSQKKMDERSNEVEKAGINKKQVDESSAIHSDKKIRGKNSVKGEEAENAVGSTDEPVSGPLDEKKKKKKKKSKKKRLESEEAKIEGQVTVQVSKAGEYKKNPEEEATPKPKSNKKRKQDESTTDLSSNGSAAPTLSTPTLKNNKKQKRTTPPSAMIESDGIVDVFSETEINQSSSSSEEAETSDSAARRVKFGKMNHCKSYKASMKALKTLDQQVWSTANRTPDKSILLKSKLSDVTSSSKKKQGKKRSE